LYLVPEPFRVGREMVRVLRPGGRIAILTSYSGQAPPIRAVLTTAASKIGLTMFDRQSFVDLFTSPAWSTLTSRHSAHCSLSRPKSPVERSA